MRMRTLSLLAICAAGCTAVPAQHASVPEAAKIALYESYPQDPRPYRQIKRIWVDSWRSNLRVPLYASEQDGANAMRNQALALGGDAVMNFVCYRRDANIPHAERPALHCNGTVVKFL